MTSPSTIVLEYVCPAFGALTANLMFFAPVRDVRSAVVHGDGLASLNPTPWAFMLGNTIGWVVYGLMLKNIFVFIANAPGLLVSIWLNLQAAKLQYESFRLNDWKSLILDHHKQQQSLGINHDEQARKAAVAETTESTTPSMSSSEVPGKKNANECSDLADLLVIPPRNLVPPHAHDMFVLANAGLWVVVLAILYFGGFATTTQEFVVGMITNSLCVVFYASPLSTIGRVLRHRNASTIHIPTMLTNTSNGIFWAAYGFTMSDHFISVPNSLGAALGGIQILLCLGFSRRTMEEEAVPTTTVDTNTP